MIIIHSIHAYIRNDIILLLTQAIAFLQCWSGTCMTLKHGLSTSLFLLLVQILAVSRLSRNILLELPPFALG